MMQHTKSETLLLLLFLLLYISPVYDFWFIVIGVVHLKFMRKDLQFRWVTVTFVFPWCLAHYGAPLTMFFVVVVSTVHADWTNSYQLLWSRILSFRHWCKCLNSGFKPSFLTHCCCRHCCWSNSCCCFLLACQHFCLPFNLTCRSWQLTSVPPHPTITQDRQSDLLMFKLCVI